LVSNWTRTRKKSEVAAQLIAARIPSAPVREISEVVNDEHMHARGALEWIDHPRYGRIAVQRSPMRFSGTDPIPLEPSADLGADNDEVYADWLGLDEDKLRSLREAGVI
jgi:formyl-CoA transferase